MTYPVQYSAKTIAHWFIQRNMRAMDESCADNMTLMKLLKLLYYAEGCALALKDVCGFFPEDILAWEHGPVVAEVYNEYCNDPYNLPLSDADKADTDTIATADRDILGQVYQVFGQYSASGLRNKTHAETPWIEATENGTVLNRKISRETMKNFFRENYVEVD